MERIQVRITRPDFKVYDIIFTNVKIQKDETGISVYVNDSNRMLSAFYPLRWAVEVVNVELID